MITLQDRPTVSLREEPPAIASLPSVQEGELVNAATHGIGLVLSIVGTAVLIARANAQGDAWHVAGCSVFAATLIAMYTASTLSHSLSRTRLRRLSRSLDQGSIYLLIAGTYTPFALSYLRTGWCLPFFGLMWIVALWGCVSKILFSHRVEAVAVWDYLLLAWVPIVASYWLLEWVPAVAFWWMLTGGLYYTVGTVFLAYDDRHPYFHAIWHLFVIAGSACHFFVILLFVASSPACLA